MYSLSLSFTYHHLPRTATSKYFWSIMIRFDGLQPEVMQAMCTPMHLIVKASPASQSRPAMGALYLGSLSATMEKSILHEHKITHLVQVLDVPWLPITEKDGFECYRIDILDIPSANLRGELEGACKDIDNALRGGQNVLVHCQQVNCLLLLPAVYLRIWFRSQCRAYLVVRPSW